MSATSLVVGVALLGRTLAFPVAQAEVNSSTQAIVDGVNGIANTIGSLTDGLDICTLEPTDPASWGLSKAGEFMQNWFDANGTSNWLNAMD